MALGLTLGIILAVSGGNATKIDQSALGAAASPSGSASASASPAPTSTAAAPAAAANVNCDIIVPANPLSARGLATPYQLTGPNGETPQASGCQMTNAANLGAFVQATILNPRTGALSVYNPLVVTQGTTPAIAPTVPTLPPNAIVTIDLGFNGTDLFQVGATANALQQGNCVNGRAGSVFGQVSFCNGTNFFSAARRLVRAGRLAVPSAGTTTKIVPTAGALGTGNACPTTRNFDMVDQDPSDNVTTMYLLDPVTGQTAQNTAANTANLTGAQVLFNGSDNALLDGFIDPLLGCTPFMAPDLGNNGRPATSQALDELLAARNQPRIAALVPENDEMALNNGQLDPVKTNLYRSQIGQAPISFRTNRTSSPAMFCQNLVNIQTPFLAANQNLLATGTSPVPAVGDTLLTFMANRLLMSFTNLGCQNFGLTNPVTVVLNGAGAATQATFNTTPQTASNTAGTGQGNSGGGQGNAGAGWGQLIGQPSPGQQSGGQRRYRGRWDHWLMDPSGM
jgi:hypothetical protein